VHHVIKDVSRIHIEANFRAAGKGYLQRVLSSVRVGKMLADDMQPVTVNTIEKLAGIHG
jgi:hypothetical protein